MAIIVGDATDGVRTGLAGRIANAVVAAFNTIYAVTYGSSANHKRGLNAFSQGLVDALNNDKINISTQVEGYQKKRVGTGSIGAGAYVAITVTWDTAFADANYTVVASVEDSTSGAGLSVHHIDSHTAGSCVVRIQNTSGGALSGTIHAFAIHD